MRRNKWTENEITILKKNYFNGVEYVVELLPKHTRNSIKKKAKKFDLKVDNDKLYYDIVKISKIIKESYSYADVFRKMNKSKSGDSYKTLKQYIERNNIDVSHFEPWKNNKSSCSGKPITFWLKNGTKISSTKLKDKLYKEGIKERKCELCGQGEDWNGGKMSLILDHINGVNNDNRLENLRIVCPNCNATLPTHCRGNKYKKEKIVKKREKKRYFCECGKEIRNRNKNAKCIECFNISQRKVERPDKDTLLKEIEELGYTGTGRKYSVSDNAIRKWIKNMSV